LDEDAWADAVLSAVPSYERQPWRERQRSWHTGSAAAVTGARIVGTIAEIVARTGGIDVELA
jgi:hypothetical protein